MFGWRAGGVPQGYNEQWTDLTTNLMVNTIIGALREYNVGEVLAMMGGKPLD